MALSSTNAVNEIAHALGTAPTAVVIDKASISNAVAGRYYSLWRATGQPGQGAIPTTAAVCTGALAGAMVIPNVIAPIKNYLAWAEATCGNNATSLIVVDRLAHMGGLSGTVTTAQGALTLTGVAADRIGATDYSELRWFLEWYTDTGSTAVTMTVNVTYNDDTTGNVSVSAVATSRASGTYPIVPAVAGKFIKSVNSVTHATTGTAGNYGITATRPLTAFSAPLANKLETYDWAQLGVPHVPNDRCLMLMMLCSTTTTGTVRGLVKIAAV